MKKDEFKLLIKEFHESPLVSVLGRDLSIPDTKKVISLVGSRRAGKTFYFFQLMNSKLKDIPKERMVYVNFEDDRLLPLNLSDLDGLLEGYYELYPKNKGKTIFYFLDEIQNIKNWEAFIRRLYDTQEAQIYLTGSSSKLLSKEIATSLRGRTLTFELFPLSFREFLRFKKIELGKHYQYSKVRFEIKKAFEQYLEFGGFAEVTLEEQSSFKHKILGNYFEMIIYRDVVDRFSIRNTALLKNMCKYALTNISKLFSINSYYKNISKQMPAAKDTIMDYLSHLEDINLLYMVPLFSYSLRQQNLNPRKVYCVDNGLRNAVAFKFSKDDGRLAKNLAFIELKRRGREVFYWKEKNEVDFVIKNPDSTLEAINVCYSNNIPERELKGLEEFKKKFPKTKHLLLLTKDVEKKQGSIHFIPLWKWLLEKK